MCHILLAFKDGLAPIDTSLADSKYSCVRTVLLKSDNFGAFTDTCGNLTRILRCLVVTHMY